MTARSTLLAWRVLCPMDRGAWRAVVHWASESDMTVATEHAAQHNISEAFSLAQS